MSIFLAVFMTVAFSVPLVALAFEAVGRDIPQLAGFAVVAILWWEAVSWTWHNLVFS